MSKPRVAQVLVVRQQCARRPCWWQCQFRQKGRAGLWRQLAQRLVDTAAAGEPQLPQTLKVRQACSHNDRHLDGRDACQMAGQGVGVDNNQAGEGAHAARVSGSKVALVVGAIEDELLRRCILTAAAQPRGGWQLHGRSHVAVERDERLADEKGDARGRDNDATIARAPALWALAGMLHKGLFERRIMRQVNSPRRKQATREVGQVQVAEAWQAQYIDHGDLGRDFLQIEEGDVCPFLQRRDVGLKGVDQGVVILIAHFLQTQMRVVLLVALLVAVSGASLFTAKDAKIRMDQALASRAPVDNVVLAVTEAVRALDPKEHATTKCLKATNGIAHPWGNGTPGRLWGQPTTDWQAITANYDVYRPLLEAALTGAGYTIGGIVPAQEPTGCDCHKWGCLLACHHGPHIEVCWAT